MAGKICEDLMHSQSTLKGFHFQTRFQNFPPNLLWQYTARIIVKKNLKEIYAQLFGQNLSSIFIHYIFALLIFVYLHSYFRFENRLLIRCFVN